jgi:hypothetical protein
MLPEELFEAHRGLSAPFLTDFTGFLRSGTFNFAWDD